MTDEQLTREYLDAELGEDWTAADVNRRLGLDRRAEQRADSTDRREDEREAA